MAEFSAGVFFMWKIVRGMSGAAVCLGNFRGRGGGRRGRGVEGIFTGKCAVGNVRCNCPWRVSGSREIQVSTSSGHNLNHSG